MFCLSALDHLFVSTLLTNRSIGDLLYMTLHRHRLLYGLLPVGSVVNILLTSPPASRGDGIFLRSDPPSQTTTPASSPDCTDGGRDCEAITR
jgi:hypothetical protein